MGSRALRLGAVLAILVAEFAFVLWVFSLDAPVQDRRVEVARAQALTYAVRAGADPVAVGERVERVTVRLLALDAPGADAVAEAGRGDLATQRGRTALADAVRDTEAAVEAQQGERDRLQVALLLGMFLVVSVGWFTWFARLARRHRTLQEDLTRHEVGTAGERRLQALVRNSVDVVAVLEPDTTMSFVTPSAATVLGRDPQQLVGRRFTELLTRADRLTMARLLSSTDGAEQALTLRLAHPDGRVLSLEGTVKDLLDDPDVAGWVMTVRDVSEKQALEQDLAHQAFHDSLTGLANRQLVTDRLAHSLLRRRGAPGRRGLGGALSVLVLGLDDFTEVNDRFGRPLGDQVLLELARRVRDELRPGDTAARLGGDEFAVLLDDVDLQGARDAADRLLLAIRRPLDLGGEQHRVRASIGLATTDTNADTGTDTGPGPGADDTEDGTHLLRDAETAMHEAKLTNRSGVVVYDPGMRARALDTLQLRTDLSHAVAAAGTDGQLVLHFQPTVSLTTQTVSGFEALLRWQHPVRGPVSPVDFIPLAEESGQILELGAWVLLEACRAGAQMQHGGSGPSMAVNVATPQLSDPGFADGVLEALRLSGLPADRLVLEITETALLHDLDRGVAVLTGLRTHGIRVAIDDFGTGYSSLAQLSALPIDVLKIDKVFVDRLLGDGADVSLVEAILTMSTAMHLVSVAEGVEHASQAIWLREHHASLGQGYFWSRPVPLPQALDLLRDGVPSMDPVLHGGP